MIAPPPSCAIICLPARLQPKKTPLTLIWMTVFHPLALMSSTLARKEAPALLTMMSRRPISFAVRSTSALTASSWRTSTASQKERRPSFVISATTGSRFSFLRLQITTSAPALANSMAMERPMPTPPPVTIATFFSSETGDAAMVPPVPVVEEAEAGRMEAQPAELAPGAAVLAVADDRVADGRELHADLPAPARVERELEERRVLPAREHPVARDGRLALRATRGVDTEAPVLDEATLERPGLLAHVALHERRVDALDRSLLELGLEALLGFRGLGEDQEPRGLAVEAVDDEGACARPLRLEIVPEQSVGGALALALGRHGEESRRLVHDDDRVVLVHEAETLREGDAAAPPELDAVVSANRGAAI